MVDAKALKLNPRRQGFFVRAGVDKLDEKVISAPCLYAVDMFVFSICVIIYLQVLGNPVMPCENMICKMTSASLDLPVA